MSYYPENQGYYDPSMDPSMQGYYDPDMDPSMQVMDPSMQGYYDPGMDSGIAPLPPTPPKINLKKVIIVIIVISLFAAFIAGGIYFWKQKNKPEECIGEWQNSTCNSDTGKMKQRYIVTTLEKNGGACPNKGKIQEVESDMCVNVDCEGKFVNDVCDNTKYQMIQKFIVDKEAKNKGKCPDKGKIKLVDDPSCKKKTDCVGSYVTETECSTEKPGYKKKNYVVTKDEDGGTCPNRGKFDYTPSSDCSPVNCTGEFITESTCSPEKPGYRKKYYNVTFPEKRGGICPNKGKVEYIADSACNPVNCEVYWMDVGCSNGKRSFKPSRVIKEPINGGTACPTENKLVSDELCDAVKEFEDNFAYQGGPNAKGEEVWTEGCSDAWDGYYRIGCEKNNKLEWSKTFGPISHYYWHGPKIRIGPGTEGDLTKCAKIGGNVKIEGSRKGRSMVEINPVGTKYVNLFNATIAFPDTYKGNSLFYDKKTCVESAVQDINAANLDAYSKLKFPS